MRVIETLLCVAFGMTFLGTVLASLPLTEVVDGLHTISIALAGAR